MHRVAFHVVFWSTTVVFAWCRYSAQRTGQSFRNSAASAVYVTFKRCSNWQVLNSACRVSVHGLNL
jgi:hypothetical protein